MSSSSFDVLADGLRPCGALVVEGTGFEAAVRDAGQPVSVVAQRGPVVDPAGTLGVVAGPGAR
jgi:hypothetical protein